MTPALPSRRFTAYISDAIDGTLSAYSVDTVACSIELHARYAAAEAVMSTTLCAKRATLYAATRGASPSIISYHLNASDGTLVHARATTIDANLAYLAAEPSGQYLFGASYGEHRLCVYGTRDMASGHGSALQVIEGIEHAHAVVVSADGDFAYVTSLGANRIFCFGITKDEERNPLALLDMVQLADGFGPRHIRLSPDEHRLYVLSEFRATVATFDRDAVTGRLHSTRLSDRPPAVSHLHDGRARAPSSSDTLASHVWAADIRVTPDNRYLYVSERTSSRLIIYSILEDGSLEYRAFTNTETQPRGFQIDASGRFLVACGERSSHVSLYAIEPETGALTLLSRVDGGRGANWVEIINHP